LKAFEKLPATVIFILNVCHGFDAVVYEWKYYIYSYNKFSLIFNAR